jgi:hypothetical protein
MSVVLLPKVFGIMATMRNEPQQQQTFFPSVLYCRSRTTQQQQTTKNNIERNIENNIKTILKTT